MKVIEQFCEKTSGWDYSDLTKAAKCAGGVKPFINAISVDGNNKGLIKGFSISIAVVVVSFAAYQGVKSYKRSREIHKALNSIIDDINNEKAAAFAPLKKQMHPLTKQGSE